MGSARWLTHDNPDWTETQGTRPAWVYLMLSSAALMVGFYNQTAESILVLSSQPETFQHVVPLALWRGVITQ